MTGRPVAGDRGSLTLWMVGLCVALLFVGGISLDLWRVFSERRSLAGIVDAAAVAGASGVDVAEFRASGAVVLDPALAERLSAASLARQTDTRSLTGVGIDATPDAVTVTGTGVVEPTLLTILVPADAFTIEVSAHVEPRRSP